MNVPKIVANENDVVSTALPVHIGTTIHVLVGGVDALSFEANQNTLVVEYHLICNNLDTRILSHLYMTLLTEYFL